MKPANDRSPGRWNHRGYHHRHRRVSNQVAVRCRVHRAIDVRASIYINRTVYKWDGRRSPHDRFGVSCVAKPMLHPRSTPCHCYRRGSGVKRRRRSAIVGEVSIHRSDLGKHESGYSTQRPRHFRGRTCGKLIVVRKTDQRIDCTQRRFELSVERRRYERSSRRADNLRGRRSNPTGSFFEFSEGSPNERTTRGSARTYH